MRRLSVMLFALGMTAPAWAGIEHHTKEGAICDRQSGFCADHMGVSVGLTKLYLGDKAEKKLMAEIGKVGSENFNPTAFTMRGGLTCNAQEKQCWTSKARDKPHNKATQTLFGK